MKGENNQKRNSGKDRNLKISNSRAMGVISLIALLFVFQVVTFIWHKVNAVRMEGEVAVKGDSVEVGSGFADTGGAGASGSSIVADGASVSAAGVVMPVKSGRGSRFSKGERFPFNPNSISADSLQLMGFSAKQAQSILRYRSKGGKFRHKEDFSKLYVVDSAMYAALEEYIALPHRSSGTKEVRGVPGGAGVGTNRGNFVPDKGVKGTAGTNMAQNVPARADSSGRKPLNTDSSGRVESIYGKKVAKNRYMCNLNTADSAELVNLYGIGGYYARKILQYRERLGGSFVDVRQLLEIDGFTQERFGKIEMNIFVRREDVKPFSILDAERETLERHPYIGPYAARGIVTYLKLKGKDAFANDVSLLEQLVKERVISEENARKLGEYLLHL